MRNNSEEERWKPLKSLSLDLCRLRIFFFFKERIIYIFLGTETSLSLFSRRPHSKTVYRCETCRAFTKTCLETPSFISDAQFWGAQQEKKNKPQGPHALFIFLTRTARAPLKKLIMSLSHRE